MAKQTQPAATVVGSDPDLTALARVTRKARRRRLAHGQCLGATGVSPYLQNSLSRADAGLVEQLMWTRRTPSSCVNGTYSGSSQFRLSPGRKGVRRRSPP
jgi:hypothetical protein